MPITGRNTGIEQTAPVTFIASIVCEATCPRLSPVMSAPASCSCATRSASRIINRRIISVNISSGQFCRIAS